MLLCASFVEIWLPWVEYLPQLKIVTFYCSKKYREDIVVFKIYLSDFYPFRYLATENSNFFDRKLWVKVWHLLLLHCLAFEIKPCLIDVVYTRPVASYSSKVYVSHATQVVRNKFRTSKTQSVYYRKVREIVVTLDNGYFKWTLELITFSFCNHVKNKVWWR